MLIGKKILLPLILKFSLLLQSIFCYIIKHLYFFKKKLVRCTSFLVPRDKSKYTVIMCDHF